MEEPQILVFASGTETGGGSGFRELCRSVRNGTLKAEIAAVVSNHANGGVRRYAREYEVPFHFFNGPFTAENYHARVALVRRYDTPWVALSGWLKRVTGLPPEKTFNIHPAPLPRFGGQGCYGIHVHEKVLEAYKNGEIARTEITMHFVTERYDEGPVFFRFPVAIEPSDSAETLSARVQEAEHRWQSRITNLVVHREIHWDGKDPRSLMCPYKIAPFGDAKKFSGHCFC